MSDSKPRPKSCGRPHPQPYCICLACEESKAGPPITAWEARVRAMEALGMDRSDAQGVVDAEDLAAHR